MSIPISKRILKTTTNLPPCCLRIHPEDTSRIYIGTYKLETETGEKHGSLDYFKYDNENNDLKLIQSIPTNSAILDIKFNPKNSNQLISGHSDGCILIWKINEENIELDQTVVIDKDSCITSIFFNPNITNQLLITFTNGYSQIFDLINQSQNWLDNSHELECWTGSFGELGELTNVVYTGGDDSQLIAHDLRTSNSIWNLKRGHDAGIVSILSPNPNWNSSRGNYLYTGSYDDHLRIWDLRCIDSKNPNLIDGYIPKKLYEENLNGGVWRLIPSTIDNRMLSCCMYDGARIINNDSTTFKVDRYFKGDHESICYGGDWSFDGKFVATCSFYDHVVQIWSPNDTEKGLNNS
ncbi:uncharacterized protein KGF55_000460 [Candida pseudojiufengensis]|uniref:uncharacterized protein n=1 Tax=Candida pseudojiufengensis TaxID=497109 RepID=UPI0022242677|nr:uncharacterized protein KGF55_000460 [Candida pseudojiufengensis]KAI5966151.1 hypothetical protein KGF55_000460 [Candida pseudojiufengensis]